MLKLLLVCTLVADPSAWWENYGDPTLTRLIERAREANLEVRKALARVAESRAMAAQAKSALAPAVGLQTSAQQLRGGFQNGIIRIPPSGPGGVPTFISPFETGLISGGADVRWELSFWGPNSKALNAAQADLLAAEESADEVRLMVAAEVARAYFAWRGAGEQLWVLERNRERQAELLDLTRVRARAGLASELDVELQRSALAALEAQIPRVASLRQIELHRLAVLLADRDLVNRPPAGEPALPSPPPLGAGIDSALLLRRPDVRATQARMLAARDRLKAARAESYPRVILAGLSGRQATSFSGLSFGGGNFFGIGPQLVLPLFTGGRLRANIQASDARLEAAELEYEQELLAAFQEAEDAIAAYRAEQARLGSLTDARNAAETALALAQELYRAGLGDFLAVLEAERTLLELERALGEARTAALVQSVQLFKALAGGWPVAN
jgi:NodT family efflux transporter outer membrane factor (OMF) lipoprotein